MMRYLKRYLFLFVFFFNASIIYCQTIENSKSNYKSSFYQTLEYTQPEVVDTIFLDSEITSLSLTIDLEDEFKGAEIISNEETFIIQEEHHDPAFENKRYSQLIIFDSPVTSFIFKRGKIKGNVLFHLINSGATPQINKNNHKLKQGCGRPATINQSEWRAGLPAPDYSPVYSEVNHIIVHHSAGSNSDKNYTNVVRQIYLYHTEVRKYSDIAYNFLIAEDGTIYEGREGADEKEEDVVGAHFCGKNTNTMGVCLLGNYETAVPSAEMIYALEQLMAWKLSKENLDPFEANIHPAGSNTKLGVIAGHRDGCPTLCPGEYVYVLMNVIKENTSELMKDLGSEIPMPSIVKNENQESGKVILEVTGGEEGSYLWFTSENPKDSIQGQNSSRYTTSILNHDTAVYVAIKEGDCAGPWLKIDVSVKEDQFIVYPNPTAGLITIILNKSFKLSEFVVLNSVGKKVDIMKSKVKDNNILVDTSLLASGVYILILKSEEKTYNKKLIVN